MVQQGQVFQLRRCGPDDERLWAYRYRTAAATPSAFNEAGSPWRPTRVTHSSASSSGFDERRASRADSRSTSWSRRTSLNTTSSR